MKKENDSVEEKKISTPDATRSNPLKIAMFIVVLLVITYAIKNKISKGDDSSKSPNKMEKIDQNGERENYITLNLLDISYNNYLTYNLEGGKKVKVLLTNDYCPIWTSANVNMYQSNGTKRIICGTKIVQGEKSTPTQSYLFENTTNMPIVIKVGRNKTKVETFNFN